MKKETAGKITVQKSKGPGKGWKKGKKFYLGFGWLSQDELFDLRQTDPRIAP